MKIVRSLLALAVVVVAVAAVERLCWRRYACDVEKGRAERRLTRAFTSSNDALLIATGRAAIERLRPCLAHDPFDYQLYAAYGMAAHASGNKDLALEMYETALRLNERPEILANIAELQFERGEPAKARANLLRAASFHIAYVRKVSEPLRSELVKEVEERRHRLLAAPR